MIPAALRTGALIATMAGLSVSGGAAQAQDWGRWSSGAHEFAEGAAWVNALTDGTVASLNVMCAADVAYVSFNLDGLYGADRVATASMKIGPQVFEGESRFRSEVAEPAWAMVAPADLIEALKTGGSVEVSVAGLTRTFGLRGSRAAIEAALAGCGSGAGFHPDRTTFFQFVVYDATGQATVTDRPPGAEEAGAQTEQTEQTAQDTQTAVADGTAGDTAEGTASADAAAAEPPMRFFNASNGGNCQETCQWIAAEGRITDDTPAAFEALIAEGLPHKLIYINSSGGKLAPALALGRRFRELGLSTAVGVTAPFAGGFSSETRPGVCLSACAYMFLGGVSRSLDGVGMSVHSFDGLENDSDRVLGFHGLSFDPGLLGQALQFDLLTAEAAGTDLDAAGTLVYGAAEFSSGAIVEYLTDMGIDARLLQAAIASGDGVDRLDMKYPSNAELSAFGVFSAQTAEYTPFALQIVGDGLVATAVRRGVGTQQNRRATMRLLRACAAPTPWIVYTVGPDSDAAGEVPTLMADPAHDSFSIAVGDAPLPDGNGSYATVTFSRTNDHAQIHRAYIEAFGGGLTEFGDMTLPSFASSDALTIFVPLSDDWRATVAAGSVLEWLFYPRVNGVPKLRYTFSAADAEIAGVIDAACLSEQELARIRY
ncbi:MAG: hypothetical protein AAF484_11380 [Pseudomonadota bacterium]